MSVQEGSVLRTGARLLSGGHMEPYSMLLEHSLVMPGDTVDERTVLQGWPTRLHMTREEYYHFFILHSARRNQEYICANEEGHMEKDGQPVVGTNVN